MKDSRIWNHSTTENNEDNEECSCWECEYGDDSELEGLDEHKQITTYKKFLESENGKKLLKELKYIKSK